MVYKDVRQIEKNQIAIKTQAVLYPVVSQQQKLCKAEQSKGQTSADAAFNGAQGRMAPLKIPLTLQRQLLLQQIYKTWVNYKQPIKRAYIESVDIGP